MAMRENAQSKRELDDDKRKEFLYDVILLVALFRMHFARGLTYGDDELVLEPLQVEVDVRLGHLLVAPAGQLGEDSRRHVDDEAVRAVQERQERRPDVLLALRGVVQEDFDAAAVLLRCSRFNHELAKSHRENSPTGGRRS